MFSFGSSILSGFVGNVYEDCCLSQM